MTVDESRAATTKSGSHNDHRTHVISHYPTPDLTCGIETDWLRSLDRNRLPRPEPRLLSHEVGDPVGHRIGRRDVIRAADRDEGARRQTCSHELRRALEDEVVRIEVLDEDDVTRGQPFRADEASRNPGSPESAREDPRRGHDHQQGQSELPRRLHRLGRVEEMSLPPAHPRRSPLSGVGRRG